MGQVKQMAMDNAEENVDLIVKDFVDNKIDLDTAKSNILEVENVNMTGIDSENVDEVLIDAVKKTSEDFANMIIDKINKN
jgi:hypothetical protein